MRVHLPVSDRHARYVQHPGEIFLGGTDLFPELANVVAGPNMIHTRSVALTPHNLTVRYSDLYSLGSDNLTKGDPEMHDNEAREIFNNAIAESNDADQRASLEVVREFFTNPEFREALADYSWQRTALSGVRIA